MRSDKVRKRERNIAEIKEEQGKDIKRTETELAEYPDAGWRTPIIERGSPLQCAPRRPILRVTRVTKFTFGVP
jgi:hypothetical protein